MDTIIPAEWNTAGPLQKFTARLLTGCVLLLLQIVEPLPSLASLNRLSSSGDCIGFLRGERFALANMGNDGSPDAERSLSLPANDVDSAASRKEAIRILSTITHLDSSNWWPHIRPALFLENLRNNIYHPLSIYQGSNTNFCGYAALTYLPLHDDPAGWLRFMLAIYRDGQASFNGIAFTPSARIHVAAGTLVFKGVLDIRPADQLWFLMLADHFRGYLNIFTPRFRDGSEDTFWAAVNLGKFCRMVRRLGGYKTHTRGSDLIRPSIHELYDYISSSMKTGITFLYVDNTYLYKKNHGTLKLHIPTHYLVLTDIRHDDGPDGLLTITYWDYGGKSLRKISEEFLKKITYGVVHCTKTD
ncbi:MAG: hypothetical protein P4L51_10885 [Puia sp.]|nr:hypothetical protein [Puia sp.]